MGLTDMPMERLQPFFPKNHGMPRIDDRSVPGEDTAANRTGLRWRNPPWRYDPPKTLYNQGKRWGRTGLFALVREGLAFAAAVSQTVMIDATFLNANRTAASLRSKRMGWGPKGAA